MGSSFAEKWEELSGKNNWEGLLDPLDIDLRKYLIHYGELAQICTDTFISDTFSKNNGASRYSRENLFTGCGADHLNKLYVVTKFFYATASDLFHNDKEQNWMGYIAVATDEGKVALGRRDIVIVWRGTVQEMEVLTDVEVYQIPAETIFNDHPSPVPLVHNGFLTLYTFGFDNSKFKVTCSARDQITDEVKRLVEKYKDEEVSISLTGHSLGASMATMTAVDLAYNGFNTTSQGKEFPVTAFPLACLKVGNPAFRTAFNKLDNLRCLKIHNVPDMIPNLPFSWLGYEAVGEEVVFDTSKSPYLKSAGLFEGTAHNMEVYIHGIAGGHGQNGDFKLEVNRDVSLVNKQTGALKDELCIPDGWWAEENKAMVQTKDGSWAFEDRDHYPFPY